MKSILLRRLSLWNRARLDRRRSAKVPYAAWIKAHDTLSPVILRSLAARESISDFKPTFSIVLDLRDATTKGQNFSATLESVVKQTCPNWELLVTNLHLAQAGVADQLREWRTKEPRIKLSEGPASLAPLEHINQAIQAGVGQFFIFIDLHARLRPHALTMLTRAMQKHPEGKVFYSDEDQLCARGVRKDPRFKPDWNEYFFRSKNYLGQLSAFDSTLLNSIGGFRTGFEADPSYDLVLRCAERLSGHQIVHIPLILYHASLPAPPTASAVAAGSQAVQEHLARLGIAGQVTTAHQLNHIAYPCAGDAPCVSIIIPSRDRPELLKTCVSTVLRTTAYPNFEVIFLDNGTTNQEALDLIQEFNQDPRFRSLADHSPFNYSKLNNQGVSQATGEFICLLNNDVEITDAQWLGKMVAICQQKDVGVVGARLLYPTGQLQHAGVILGIGGVAGHPFAYKAGDAPTYMDRAQAMQELSAVTGACLLTHKKLFDQVGGLDEVLSVAFNDIDFCLKVRTLGQKVVYTPDVELVHHESASRGKDDTQEKKTRFSKEIKYMQDKWRHWLEADPAYNPNLTLQSDGFSLSDSPRVQVLTY